MHGVLSSSLHTHIKRIHEHIIMRPATTITRFMAVDISEYSHCQARLCERMCSTAGLMLAACSLLLVSVSAQNLQRGSLPYARVPAQHRTSSFEGPEQIKGQENCTLPVVYRPDFSVTQTAYLVSELQASLSSGCYSMVSTSLAVCLPDLSLASGCCTPDCERSLRLTLNPECIAQFWSYICSNASYYTTVVGGVVERCLPSAAGGLRLTCPVNSTLVNALLNLGRTSVGSATAAAGMNTTVQEAVSNGGVTLPIKTDQQYYSDCSAQAPVLWPDFNGSYLFDSLLAFAHDVPQDCLRTALSYLPSCYDDLLYESGCCSLRCRAAIEKVDLTCLASYVGSLCDRIPQLTKYFFNAAYRCAGINITCSGFNQGGVVSQVLGPDTNNLPLVAGEGGQCPFKDVSWPGYNAADVTSQTLRLLANTTDACSQALPRVNTDCASDLGKEQGCCSYNCAIAMRSVPDTCHAEFRKLLCEDPATAKFMITAAQRCLGAGAYDCNTNTTSTASSSAGSSSGGGAAAQAVQVLPVVQPL